MMSTQKRQISQSAAEEVPSLLSGPHDDDEGTIGDSNDEPSAPQPISSEDDENKDKKKDGSKDKSPVTMVANSAQRTSSTCSRLFAPYRTVGIVSSGAPFHLLPNQNSAQALVAVPIGERLQLLQADRLHPVLVTQAVTTTAKKNGAKAQQQQRRTIRHVITDASLSISVVTHGTVTMSEGAADTVTLFHRTRPLDSRRLAGTQWKICDLLSMGRIQVEMSGEKEGCQENAAVMAVILAKNIDYGDDDDDSDSSMESSSESTTSSDSSNNGSDDDVDDDGDEDDDNCLARIVVLIATRTSFRIHKRISLTAIPTFSPHVAVHPATYLNKIVVGGCTIDGPSKQQHPAACLVNVRSGKVVHVFQCLETSSKTTKDKIDDSSHYVTALVQAPAIDTVAIGTNRGAVHLVNLKHDKTLFTLHHKSRDGNRRNRPAITSLSFRTDGSAMRYGVAPLAVGRSDGNITVWDLNEDKDTGARTILCEMDRVHPGGVAKLQYFPQEPLLLSTGKTSNSILMHIFDKPDHSPRVLRQRRGHSAPPRKIRYLHEATGGVLANTADGTDASTACQILSSGGPDRTLRVLSTARSVLDKEYSQGPGLEKRARALGLDSAAELRLPPLVDWATCEARSRDWGDLVTIHQNHSFAYVWSTRRGAQCGPVLRQEGWNVSAMKTPPPYATQATAVALSACGSLAVVGTRGGTIYRYNVQSGIPRGSYPIEASSTRNKRKGQSTVGNVNRTTKALERTLKTGGRSSNLDKTIVESEQTAAREKRLSAKLRSACHMGYSVTGLAVDGMNKNLISVGADAKLIIWNFQTHAPHKKSPYMLPCPATKMCHVRESDLAAIALDDFSAVLFDCTALAIVRRFGKGSSQHRAAISDLGFSPDGRTLYTASLDMTIRVWDVPTNTCVDWLGFKSAPTSLTVSPTGEYLATTHERRLGICIWSDKSYYQTVHIDGVDILEPARMDEPLPISDVHQPGTDSMITMLASNNIDIAIDDDEQGASKIAAVPKEFGLITLSGLPVAHWKNLFHLELVKQRNKPKEPPTKPPSAPFFLQWRSGEPIAGGAQHDVGVTENDGAVEDEEWAAAWSDNEDSAAKETNNEDDESACKNADKLPNKRRKVTHYRSKLATLLQDSAKRPAVRARAQFQSVMDYIATLGPSAIDVELSALCNGMHDLEEGFPLLLLASQWLLEACASRERFEATNAYLHRFLHLHTFVIAGIRDGTEDAAKLTNPVAKTNKDDERENRLLLLEAIAKLQREQQAATDTLKNKMEHTLCLLRHFSRMV